MTRMRLILVFGLVLLIAGFGLMLAARSDAQTAPAAQAPETDRLLVLLRMPTDHYDGQSGYGGSYGGGAKAAARRHFAEDRARAHGLKLVDDWPMPMAGLDCYVMAVPGGTSVETAAADLSHDPGVEWAEPMQTYRAQGSVPGSVQGSVQGNPKPEPTNDPLYRIQPDAREWRLDALHKLATGRNVRVAVIDSAVEARHPDLAGQVVVSQNFVPGPTPAAEAHGNGVAGIIAAVSGNGKGIVGVAPEARLMALRACAQQADAAVTLCDSLSLAKAIYFAVDHRAEVINMSLAGPPDPLLGRLIDMAESRGITVVGAVDSKLPQGGFPASHPGVIAVADENGGEARAGVFGAPGRDVPTAQPGGTWGFVNGSSFAAAHISGLFALLRQRAGKPQSTSALATVQGSDTVDPCASLSRAGGVEACAPGALAAEARP